MRKSFSLIELIFVIVVIGILAAIAVPKLMSTREDAETAALTTQIQAATKEFVSYYTSQSGEINFSELPTSSQIVLNELINHGWVEIKDDNHAVFYSDRDKKRVCLNYYTDGKTLRLEQNSSDNDLLCSDIKRIIKDENYSILNEVIKF